MLRGPMVIAAIREYRLLAPGWEDPVTLEATLRNTPLGRIGEPDKVAGAAVFLASRAGPYTSGQTIVIDGGPTSVWMRSEPVTLRPLGKRRLILS